MNILHSRREFDPDVIEMMDQPAPSKTELVQALENLETLNRCFGSHRIIRHFLRRWVRPREAVTILDACTGFGDVPRMIVRWARTLGSRAEVTAIDLQPATLEIAQQRSLHFPEISYRQADLRTAGFEQEFDLVLCSLALHHFAWEEAIKILKKLRQLGKRVLVSDLERSTGGLLGVYLLTSTIFRTSPMTKHDGRLSIERAFSFSEMHSLAVEAAWAGFGHRRFLVSHQALWLDQ